MNTQTTYGIGKEVYRLKPKVGKYYYTTTYTSKSGIYPNENYYSTNKLKYVGKFIESRGKRYGDDAKYWDLFELNGEIIRVTYTDEGTTCFLEVPNEEVKNHIMRPSNLPMPPKPTPTPKPIDKEVYRLSPIEGHYYYTTTCTSKTGMYPNERYYSTNELKYVGKFVRIERMGYGDWAQVWAIFDLDDKMERVTYTYEGTTCFLEVPGEELKKIQKKTIMQQLNEKLKNLFGSRVNMYKK